MFITFGSSKSFVFIFIIGVSIFILWREDIKIKSAVQRCHQGATADKLDTTDKCDDSREIYFIVVAVSIVVVAV